MAPVTADQKWTRRSVMRLSAALGIGVASTGVAAWQAARDRPSDGLPSRVAALYWTHWNSEVALRDVPTAYNVIYLFAATRGRLPGSTWWPLSGIGPDLRVCRARRQRVLLSIGGQGQALRLRDRAESVRLVESVVRIDQRFRGDPSVPALDGVDLNTYEGRVVVDPGEYVWASRELRRRFGQAFAVTTPPAASSRNDRAFCRELLAADAVDYVAPQFYGGPGLADPEYIFREADRWVIEVAGGDARKVVVGFGTEDLPDYSSVADILSVWPRIREAHPTIRGAFLWQHRTDAATGWAFARRVAPLVTRPSP